MKDRKSQKSEIDAAIDAVKDLESATGVKIKSGLKAGIGGGGGKGGTYQPLYGAPTGSPA